MTKPMDLQRVDTICAQATPAGTSALAIVRVSGARADDVCAKVFHRRRGAGLPAVRMCTLGDVGGIVDGADTQGVIDEGMCTRFAAAASYTGEPSFELSVHGSPRIVAQVLKALCAAGCRLAEPGEFTLRALLNGRINMLQAEAVHDVIHATSERSARAAQQHLRGGLHAQVAPLRAAVVSALAELEARLDFPDEDLGEAARTALHQQLQQARMQTSWWVGRNELGRKAAEGVRVLLYGPPNAGKSTLLNALSGEERALVHDQPGTTRDVVDVQLEWHGVAITLLDAAGIRAHDEASVVERFGIERAERERERADVVVGVVGRDHPNAMQLLSALPVDVRVMTKADLSLDKQVAAEGADVLHVCAHNALSLAPLRRAVVAHALGQDAIHDDGLLLHARQRQCMRDADDALARALSVCEAGALEEVVAHDLRVAAHALDRLLGTDINDDVLSTIFSRFCIGK
jgi:tRNA modification GTPase